MHDEPLLIVDMDGTLFFMDEPIALASSEILGTRMSIEETRGLPSPVKRSIYDLSISKYASSSIPNVQMINLLREKSAASYIVILTARTESRYADSREVLEKTAIPFDRLICRGEKDAETHDEEWKSAEIGALLPDYPAVELYEDKLENIEYISQRLNSEKLRSFHVKPGSVSEVHTSSTTLAL